jgi:hypothetical protein
MIEVGFCTGGKLAKRGNEYFAYLNLWSFVGIMMALLFIMIPPDLWQGPRHGISVHLAAVRRSAKIPRANREDTIRLLLPGTECSTLPEQIQDYVRSGAEKHVYFAR